MINTLLVIIEQSMLHLPLMFGAYISFSLLKIPDLSIESAYVVGAIFGSYVLMGTSNLPLIGILCIVVAASCVGGALVGIVSSLLTQKGKFAHLLSSIVTSGLFHGINQFICPAYVSLNKMDNPLTLVNVVAQHPELIMLVIIGFAVFITIYFLLKTEIGYCYAAYGNNPQFFKNYEISTSFVFITGVILANALAGMSGYLFAQSNSFVELNMGVGKGLLCITALMLGKGLTFIKKSFSIIVPLVGTCAYFTVQQLLLKIGFNLKYFTAVQAIIVLLLLIYTHYNKPIRSPNDGLGL